jgi:hypothetical protein
MHDHLPDREPVDMSKASASCGRREPHRRVTIDVQQRNFGDVGISPAGGRRRRPHRAGPDNDYVVVPVARIPMAPRSPGA